MLDPATAMELGPQAGCRDGKRLLADHGVESGPILGLEGLVSMVETAVVRIGRPPGDPKDPKEGVTQILDRYSFRLAWPLSFSYLEMVMLNRAQFSAPLIIRVHPNRHHRSWLSKRR